ncbi:MAG: hypothetical protein ACRD2W_20750 [Acidimicrobiales bacterium]
MRDVSYPPLPFTAEVDAEGGIASLAVLYYLAGRTIESLTTPHSLADVLALTTRTLPAAVRMARSRWPGSALAEAFRRGQRSGVYWSEELPFLVERLAMLGPDVPVGPDQELLQFSALEGLAVPEGVSPAVAVAARLLNA